MLGGKRRVPILFSHLLGKLMITVWAFLLLLFKRGLHSLH